MCAEICEWIRLGVRACVFSLKPSKGWLLSSTRSFRVWYGYFVGGGGGGSGGEYGRWEAGEWGVTGCE